MGNTRDLDRFTKFDNIMLDVDFFGGRQIKQDNGCINWAGAKHVQGYGMVGGWYFDTGKRTMTTAHRAAMMIKLDRGLGRYEFSIHTCNNPLCVNPKHLYLGGYKELHKQMIKNGNRSKTRKVKNQKQNRKYKYTDAQIQYFRTADYHDIAKKLKIDLHKAARLKHSSLIAYKWLPLPKGVQPKVLTKKTK